MKRPNYETRLRPVVEMVILLALFGSALIVVIVSAIETLGASPNAKSPMRNNDFACSPGSHGPRFAISACGIDFEVFADMLRQGAFARHETVAIGVTNLADAMTTGATSTTIGAIETGHDNVTIGYPSRMHLNSHAMCPSPYETDWICIHSESNSYQLVCMTHEDADSYTNQTLWCTTEQVPICSTSQFLMKHGAPKHPCRSDKPAPLEPRGGW